MKDKINQLRAIEKNSPDENYPLTFPIYPIKHIQRFFHDKDFLKKYGVPHDGIEILATQGTPIYAAGNGIVYHVVDNDGIGINRMLIVHNNGYITSYMYLNKILSKAGDVVKRGQIIGYSGGEP
ncbi:MAG: M23 family metallopeptidase [bacterium]|nr:M23 family metallopeptidase [bacterium]